MEPIEIARSVLSGLLAETPAIELASADVLAWIDVESGRVGEHRDAWTAARAVQAALDALDAGAVPRPTSAQIDVFRSLPSTARIAIALHEFCGYSDTQVASATGRPVEEIEQLLDGVAPPGPDAVPGPRVDDAFTVQEKVSDDPEVPDDPDDPEVPDDPPPPPPVRADDDDDIAPVVRRRRAGRRSPTRPRWWIIAVVVVLALVAAGIAASNLRDDPAPQRGPTAGLGDAATISRDQLSPGCSTPEGDAALAAADVSVALDDADRSYRLIAPAAVAPGRPRPLLIDFADLGQPVDEHVAETRFDSLAGALKLVVATPAPAGGMLRWNVTGDSAGPDDAALVERIIVDQTNALCIDQTRILLAGRGAGAHFAAAFACSHPGLVDGLVLVAGTFRPSSCPTPERLSILSLVGTADDVFPVTGGTGPGYAAALAAAGGAGPGVGYEPSAAGEAFADWTDSLDCVGDATQRVGLVVLRIATSCERDGEIWRASVEDGIHEWYPWAYDIIVQFLVGGPFPTS